jgi:hypothetical protein
MAQQFPNGTVFSVSTALATAIALTAVTNADPAVATATSPPTDGTIGVLSSGWPGLNQRVARTANKDTSTFELEGFDTTDTTRYPAGAGTGTFTPVSTWVALSQVTGIEKSGGDQQFYQWQYAEDSSGQQQQRPTFKNAKSLKLTMDFDDALAWYDALKEADEAKDPVVLRAVLPNGKTLYYYVYPSFDADPSMNLNQNMQNVATFSQISPFTKYGAAS